MQRYLEQRVGADLARKMVILTGPRQVGKATLSRQLMDRLGPAEYLNWDVVADRAIIARQSWSPRNRLLVPTTLTRYLDILEALHVVFTVRPWHDNVARTLLKSPKVCFYDTGLVRGDDGVRFENAVAAMLLKHVHCLQDARGRAAGLHYVRTRDGAKVDFALSDDSRLTRLIECKLADTAIHRPLASFARHFPKPKPSSWFATFGRRSGARRSASLTPRRGWRSWRPEHGGSGCWRCWAGGGRP